MSEVVSKKKIRPKNELSATSLNPSYSGLRSLLYDNVCRRRLRAKKKMYAAQFTHELNHMVAMKKQAFEGIRLELLFIINDNQ
ncbi:uncharacterized protein LOC106658527 [Trichogramma pretiosum]|uniref:Uncharacterized protein n=1 Tax=Trichogramma kaykai TaxID=54128 RepID=A0ABD2XIN5_9HYME|nr:uncharacterized protein LOC106658527 [Trichogramma pretiosum]